MWAKYSNTPNKCKTFKCVQISQVNLLLNLPLLIKLSYPFHRLFKSDSYIYFFYPLIFCPIYLFSTYPTCLSICPSGSSSKQLFFNISDDLHISTRQISWYLQIGSFLWFSVLPDLNYYWNYCKEKKERANRKGRKGKGMEGRAKEERGRKEARQNTSTAGASGGNLCTLQLAIKSQEHRQELEADRTLSA